MLKITPAVTAAEFLNRARARLSFDVPETDFTIREGHVTPPSGPGLGIAVDERALDALTLLKETVS